jgi:thiamine pyrophosphokinase
VVSHGEVDPGDVAHVRGAALVVAADGGTVHLEAWGIEPHVVIGDLDSLPAEARERVTARGGRLEQHPVEKDRTDTELALDRAIALGADDVVVVGALGGPRIDHAIANTLLLAAARAGRARIRLVHGPMSVRVAREGERVDLDGAEGEVVTLLAIGGDAAGVRTTGLRYPLRDETLRLGSSRGVSNEISARPASVTVGSGTLLVVEGGALQAAKPPSFEGGLPRPSGTGPPSPPSPQPKA